MAEQRIGLRNKRNQNWFWVENELIDNDFLTTYEKMIYIALIRFSNNDTSTCYPSIKRIAAAASCSERKVISTIQELEKKGLIKKQIRKISGTNEKDSNLSNLYYLYSISDVVNDVHQGSECDAPGVVNDVHQGSECDAPGVVNDMHSNNTNKNKTNITYIDLSFLNLDIEHVLLTEEQYKKLIARYDESYIKNQILALENYICNGKGKKYKDHYKVLLNWSYRDEKAQVAQPVTNNPITTLKRISVDDSKISKLS